MSKIRVPNFDQNVENKDPVEVRGKNDFGFLGPSGTSSEVCYEVQNCSLYNGGFIPFFATPIRCTVAKI